MKVVGSKLQSYATRPNGGLGIHWNLHIRAVEIYKFIILCVKPERGVKVCALMKHFSVSFLSLL